jgi:hypothetical protein
MDGWTLDQLVARVAEALAADGVRSPNGRVRDVPDARALRWYATIGLLDRPTGYRGRTALYGPRHLLQAVAVKRRQAEGRTLAQIQAELAGATDATLRRAARVPAVLLSGGWVFPPPDEPERPEQPKRPEQPGPPHLPAPPARPLPVPGPPGIPPRTRLDEVRAPRTPFWRTATSPVPAPGGPPVSGDGTAEHSGAEASRAEASGAEALHLVRLAPGATLVLTAAPSTVDVADLRAVAAPLIRLLADRGLLTAEELRHDDH